jgi:hypothetical protein
MPGTYCSQVAKTTPFENDSNDFAAIECQSAIEECSYISIIPFNFSRNGNVGSSTYLLHGDIPSNLVSFPVAFNKPKITNIAVANIGANSFTVTIGEHDGINHYVLTSVSIVSAISGVFAVSIPVTKGRQLSAYVSAGSAKTPMVSVLVRGWSI